MFHFEPRTLSPNPRSPEFADPAFFFFFFLSSDLKIWGLTLQHPPCLFQRTFQQMEKSVQKNLAPSPPSSSFLRPVLAARVPVWMVPGSCPGRLTGTLARRGQAEAAGGNLSARRCELTHFLCSATRGKKRRENFPRPPAAEPRAPLIPPCTAV